MNSEELLKQHPMYRATVEHLVHLGNAYACDDQFKRSVRPRRTRSEGAGPYQEMIKNTVVMPLCKYVVNTIIDTVHETPVDRTLRWVSNSVEVAEPAWVQSFIVDAGVAQESLDAVVETAHEYASIFGWSWVVADINQQGKPYLVPLTPQAVWDWKREGGQLVYLKVLTGQSGDTHQFRIYERGQWADWDVNFRTSATKEIQSGTLPVVPAVQLIANNDWRSAAIGIADIDIVADAQREIYRIETEIYMSSVFAKSIIRADAGVDVPAFQGGITRATKDQIDVFNIQTGDLAALASRQEELLTSIEGLCGLGGIRNNRQQVQSGVSIVEERKALHKTAKGRARTLERFEEAIWQTVSALMGVQWAGEVVYGTDFEATDTQFRMAIAKEAQLLAPESAVVKDLILLEAVKMLAPKAEVAKYEELAKAEMTTGVSEVYFKPREFVQTGQTTVVNVFNQSAQPELSSDSENSVIRDNLSD